MIGTHSPFRKKRERIGHPPASLSSVHLAVATRRPDWNLSSCTKPLPSY